MNDTIEIPSHVEIDVRRPDGRIETVIPQHPGYKAQGMDVPLRNLTERQIADMKAATKAAGRGEIIDVRHITRTVEAAKPTAADLEEADYIRRTNAIYAAGAGGEPHDRIGGAADVDRTLDHPSDME